MSEAPRVLVTGASGFVGRAVLDALARSGAAVTAAVRRETELPAGVRVCRIGELGSGTDWGEALASCSHVVHLAARAHVMRDGSGDPLAEYRRVNVAGTLALARQAVSAGVRRFVFVSSIKVNGERTAKGTAFSETDPLAPVDAYGISKAEAEAGLLDIAAAMAMEIVVIRPPLVYGPGVKANFLTLIRWLARGVPLPLGAVRENRRSFVGLGNLSDLILRCFHHPAAANQVFLASDGEDLSTTELLRRTASALGVRARLVPVPVPILMAGARLLGATETVRRLCDNLQVDISKARRVLDWSPPFTVDQELRRAVEPLRSKELAG